MLGKSHTPNLYEHHMLFFDSLDESKESIISNSMMWWLYRYVFRFSDITLAPLSFPASDKTSQRLYVHKASWHYNLVWYLSY